MIVSERCCVCCLNRENDKSTDGEWAMSMRNGVNFQWWRTYKSTVFRTVVSCAVHASDAMHVDVQSTCSIHSARSPVAHSFLFTHSNYTTLTMHILLLITRVTHSQCTLHIRSARSNASIELHGINLCEQCNFCRIANTIDKNNSSQIIEWHSSKYNEQHSQNYKS